MNILRKTRELIFTSKSIIENKDSKNGKMFRYKHVQNIYVSLQNSAGIKMFVRKEPT